MTTPASTSCPDENVLLAMAFGESPDLNSPLGKHLLNCSCCNERIASLNRQLAAIRGIETSNGAQKQSTRRDDYVPGITQQQVDRVVDGVWRGWLRPDDAASYLSAAGSEQLSLDSLLKDGLLSASQVRSLDGMCRALSINGPNRSFSSSDLADIARQGHAARAAVNDVYRPGTIVAERFLIRDILGQGGFGLVLLAEDQRTGEFLALKTPLFRTPADDQEWSLDFGTGFGKRTESFHREVERWLQLEPHPHIVTAWELFEDRKRPMLAIQYVDGGMTLAEYSSHWTTALDVGFQIATALDWVSRQAGLVHRDIKPDNILMTDDGRALLTDFGLSLYPRSEEGGRQLAGTPAYMAPELWTNPDASPLLADVYSFGVTLLEATTGTLPPPGQEEDWLDGSFPAPPRAFTELIMRCLVTAPEHRPGFREIAEQLKVLMREHNRTVHQSGKPDQQTMLRWLVHRSESFARLNQGDEALKFAKRALRLKKRDIGARHAAGNAYMLTGHYRKAENYLLAAHREDDGNFVSAGSLANMYYKSGRTAEALLWLDRAISLAMAAGRPESLQRYTDIVVDLKPPHEALSLCQQIVDAAPDAAVVWNNMAILLRRIGDIAAARQSAQRAVEINPTYAKAWVSLANALLLCGQKTEGLEAANRALRFDEELQGAWSARATALVQLGRIEEGRDTIERGLQRLPESALLLQGLQRLRDFSGS